MDLRYNFNLGPECVRVPVERDTVRIGMELTALLHFFGHFAGRENPVFRFDDEKAFPNNPRGMYQILSLKDEHLANPYRISADIQSAGFKIIFTFEGNNYSNKRDEYDIETDQTKTEAMLLTVGPFNTVKIEKEAKGSYPVLDKSRQSSLLKLISREAMSYYRNIIFSHVNQTEQERTNLTPEEMISLSTLLRSEIAMYAKSFGTNQSSTDSKLRDMLFIDNKGNEIIIEKRAYIAYNIRNTDGMIFIQNARMMTDPLSTVDPHQAWKILHSPQDISLLSFHGDIAYLKLDLQTLAVSNFQFVQRFFADKPENQTPLDVTKSIDSPSIPPSYQELYILFLLRDILIAGPKKFVQDEDS